MPTPSRSEDRTANANNGDGNDQTSAQQTDAVLVPSQPVPEGIAQISGIEFDDYKNRDITVSEMLEGMTNMGFQASAAADAVRIINNMRSWRDPETGSKQNIFLGYTSNLVSSGLRSTLRYLVQHKHVSAIVTTAGGVEEDIIKCIGSTYRSSFSANGAAMREKGWNRIGDMMVPNENYCKFENWITPIMDKMLAEQEAARDTKEPLWWTPSRVIARLGKEINDESSICYWAYKNDIPIFSPALTDGSLGDMLYFHTWNCDGRAPIDSAPMHLILDIIGDIRRINDLARDNPASMIVLGGGLVKHHIANACLGRNGADFAVYINTAQEFDGSDAGARPDEAVSWGKITAEGESVKVFAEATIVFPMIVAATFAKAGESRL